MRLALRAAALGLLALGCAGSRPSPSRTLCVLDGTSGLEQARADTFIALVMRGFDAATRRVTSPPLDCTGAQVRWEGPALRCDDGHAANTVLPDRPLGPADVVTTPVSPAVSLVWIVTTRYASGDAAGPVALVWGVGAQLRVVAVGVLRAYPERARLRLEDVGATRVLVAEGEVCAGGGDGGCVRAARLVPLRGDRFVPVPLAGEDGHCVSPAWFDLSRRELRPARGGIERLELTAGLAFAGGGLTVEEQAVVHDAVEGAGRTSSRVLHRAQATREVRWEGGRLVTNGLPLWWRLSRGEAR